MTTLLIPGHNDSREEIEAMSCWLLNHLGPDVPLHFTAFHPDWKMRDVPHTPSATLQQARDIALATGLHYVYTGNLHDAKGGSTYCHQCGELLIERDWYVLGDWNLSADGRCKFCFTPLPGLFEAQPGHWGAQRQAVRLSDFA